MSQFLPSNVPRTAAPDLARAIISRDPASPLQTDERQLLARLFSDPSALPQTFWASVIDRVVVDAPSQIPIVQLQGFSQFTATPVTIVVSEATTSTSYTDLATVGPTVSGLSDGKYVLFFSCRVTKPASDGGGRVSLSLNGAAPSDDDMAILADSSAVAQDTTISRAVQKTLQTEGSNSVTMQYKSITGTSISFALRSLIVLRYANV